MMKDTLRKLEIYPPPGKPSSPPTWEDIERLALHYAVVHRAVWLVRRGELTREEALIHVAFALAGEFQQLFHAEVERKMMEVAPKIILKPSSEPFEVSPWEEQAQATIANLAADLAGAQQELKEAMELILVLRGFRPNVRFHSGINDLVHVSGDGQTESSYRPLCWRCRAPEPCGAGCGPRPSSAAKI